MQMGLFSSSRGGVGIGKRRSYGVRRFAANKMRRFSGNTDKQEKGRNNRKAEIGRRVMTNLLSKTRMQLSSLRIMWRRKRRSATLAAATTMFAASMLTNTLSDAPSPSQHQHLQRQSQTTLRIGATGTATSASIKRHLTSVNGGGGITTTRLRQGMDKNKSRFSPSAFGAKNKKEEKLTVDSTTALAQDTLNETKKTLKAALLDLQNFMRGSKSDALLLLLTTSLVTPLCRKLGTSPILGFLAAGMVLGPNALGLISGIHSTETLAELGIVFFLFEMGIRLSFDRLMCLR